MNQITSEKSDEVLKALMLARREMGDIRKDSINPFHKSRYAALPVFINACDDALYTHGLIIYQCMSEDNEKPVLVTTLSHPESGQWIRSYSPLLNAKGDCQGLGAAITYMRRYSMAALLGVCPEEDDDGNKACAPPEKKQPINKAQESAPKIQEPKEMSRVSSEQATEIAKYTSLVDDECKKNVFGRLRKEYGVEKYADIPAKEFEIIVGIFTNNIDMNKRKLAVA